MNYLIKDEKRYLEFKKIQRIEKDNVITISKNAINKLMKDGELDLFKNFSELSYGNFPTSTPVLVIEKTESLFFEFNQKKDMLYLLNNSYVCSYDKNKKTISLFDQKHTKLIDIVDKYKDLPEIKEGEESIYEYMRLNKFTDLGLFPGGQIESGYISGENYHGMIGCCSCEIPGCAAAYSYIENDRALIILTTSATSPYSLELLSYNLKEKPFLTEELKKLGFIFDGFKINYDEIIRVSELAKQYELKDSETLPEKEWDIIDDLASEIMYSNGGREISNRFDGNEQLDLLLNLYEIFPTYWVMSQIETVWKNFDISEDTSNRLYEKIAKSLSGEDWFIKSVTYALWCEFFENEHKYVKKVWEGIVPEIKNDIGRRELLKVSGPVPMDVKWNFIIEMAKESSNHEDILKALVFSFADVFGQSDKDLTLDLLPKLTINRDQDNYYFLLRKLGILSKITVQEIQEMLKLIPLPKQTKDCKKEAKKVYKLIKDYNYCDSEYFYRSVSTIWGGSS